MAKALSPSDPSSFSRPDLCVVKALHIDLDVDFEKHILIGKVTLNVERKAADVKSLVSFVVPRHQSVCECPDAHAVTVTFFQGTQIVKDNFRWIFKYLF